VCAYDDMTDNPWHRSQIVIRDNDLEMNTNDGPAVGGLEIVTTISPELPCTTQSSIAIIQQGSRRLASTRGSMPEGSRPAGLCKLCTCHAFVSNED
jgi:hypothetical protein